MKEKWDLKFLFILFLILIIVLVWGVLNQPKFTITEEFCEEELKFLSKINEDYMKKNDLTSDFLFILEGSNFVENDELYTYETTCSQVEVDEIFIPKESIWKASSNCVFNSNEVSVFGAGGDWEGTKEEVIQGQREFDERYHGKCKDGSGIYPYEEIITNETKISKQDLTIEWLDENAECVEKYNKEFSAICSEKNSGGCENFSYDKCYEYKLYNYTIEVK